MCARVGVDPSVSWSPTRLRASCVPWEQCSQVLYDDLRIFVDATTQGTPVDEKVFFSFHVAKQVYALESSLWASCEYRMDMMLVSIFPALRLCVF